MTAITYDLHPDYSRPLFALSRAQSKAMLGKLTFIYGGHKARRTLKELERLLQVHYAHKPPEMIEFERRFERCERFTEKDVILITYGDLVRDEKTPPLATFNELCATYLQEMFSTIHILPFFPYSSDRGFAVVTFTDVDPNLGTWDDIARLKQNFRLMFDGVINHISSRSHWFQEFLNQNPEYADFFTSFPASQKIAKATLSKIFRPRLSDVLTGFDTLKGRRKVWTTFGPDQIDLKFQNPAVLLRMADILLYYTRRGADLIRLDAVTYLWDELGTTGVHMAETHEIIKLFRSILDAVAPTVALITETNVPHAENIRYFGNGRDEAQMVYNFALPPIALHTFQTGSAARLTQWARGLKAISHCATYFNFLDSHDGVGLLGAKGYLTEDEITALVKRTTERGGYISCRRETDGSETPYEMNITSYSALNRENSRESTDLQIRRYLAARSVPLALRGVPGIYLHGLLGSRNDEAAVRSGGEKRNINRKNLGKTELFRALRHRRTTTARVVDGMRRMITARQRCAAFHPNADQRVLDCGPNYFVLLRTATGDRVRVLAAVNVTDSNQELRIPTDQLCGASVSWQDLLGNRRTGAVQGELRLKMKPYDIVWLKQAG